MFLGRPLEIKLTDAINTRLNYNSCEASDECWGFSDPVSAVAIDPVDHSITMHTIKQKLN